MGIKFDAFSIFVKDLKVITTFYRDVFGMDIDWDEEGTHAEFKHEGIRFMLCELGELPGYYGTGVVFPKSIDGKFELAIATGGELMCLLS